MKTAPANVAIHCSRGIACLEASSSAPLRGASPVLDDAGREVALRAAAGASCQRPHDEAGGGVASQAPMFKGDTSRSKAYGAIDRFSEDRQAALELAG